jgi:sigma-B regulation protein RsbU (phosphoserine phosphatase)
MAQGDDAIRNELLQRRTRLSEAMAGAPRDPQLSQLLSEVDQALQRVQQGTFGICEACNEEIEPERLAANPLLRFCLGHLTAEEQRALGEDLELAARIQNALLPAGGLQVNGWEAHFHYQAFGPVSGDYCDLIPADGNGLYFLLGDAAGKGVAASMVMSQLHAMFRTLATLGLSPDQLLQRVNHIFCEGALSTHYATVVCGRAEANGRVEVANAGHCPPVLLRDGQMTILDSTGFPLGMFCQVSYGQHELQLGPGDALLLYTDGLSEACDGAGAEYGPERVARVAAENAPRGAQELVGAFLHDLDAFRGNAPRRDDLSILALCRSQRAARAA